MSIYGTSDKVATPVLPVPDTFRCSCTSWAVLVGAPTSYSVENQTNLIRRFSWFFPFVPFFASFSPALVAPPPPATSSGLRSAGLATRKMLRNIIFAINVEHPLRSPPRLVASPQAEGW